jgi:hypothetical protein
MVLEIEKKRLTLHSLPLQLHIHAFNLSAMLFLPRNLARGWSGDKKSHPSVTPQLSRAAR